MACPHHFTLTDAAIAGSEKFLGRRWKFPGRLAKKRTSIEWPGYDTNFKNESAVAFRPRPGGDSRRIGSTGQLRFYAAIHAPHCDYEKEVEFDYAPFGITGLETELSLSLMQLVHTQKISLADMIAKFTVNPARLLNLPKGTLSVGADADVTVFDPAS